MSEEKNTQESTKSNSEKFNLSPSLAILLSGVLIAGAIVFVNLNPAAATQDSGDQQLPTNANVTQVSANDHIVGSPSAPIILVEYSDFQCPYCQVIHTTFKRIVSESNGQVAWVYRHLPLESIHPEARPAAIAAECIAEQLGNDGFWKFADTIFADQKKMSAAYYAQLAKDFGADPAKFTSCISSDRYASKIDAQALEAQQNGGNGTPFTVLVGNGVQVPISGALPYAQFVSVINAIKARQ